MDAIGCIRARRSIRRYSGEGIDEGDLRTILECGLSAPSGNNRQPWEFFVAKDKKKLEGLSDVCTYGKFIKNSQCCVIVTGDTSKSTHVVEDCSAATENMLLAANALGYGGCWIAGWNKPYEGAVLEVMGIEAGDLRLVSLIALGRPAHTPPLRGDRSFEECVHFS